MRPQETASLRLTPEAPNAPGSVGPQTLNDDVDWTFGGAWPYEPKWFETVDGWMHYVDEGPRDAPVILLVHGNPTWGFLYRNFIPHLVDAGYRVIVPDHLGFGRSDKPARSDLYRVPRHADRFEALVESLNLRDVTIVPQDWGGPIGLAWAGRHPDRVSGLFILNTWAHVTIGRYRPPVALKLFRTPLIGEALVQGLQIFTRGFLLGQGTRKHDRLTANVRRAYLSPHRTWGSRTGVLVFPREIPVAPDSSLSPFMRGVEDGLKRLANKPVMLAWGMEDPVFTPDFIDNYWKRSFPTADVLKLPGVGHYLQEDAHEVIVPELLSFLERNMSRRSDSASHADGMPDLAATQQEGLP